MPQVWIRQVWRVVHLLHEVQLVALGLLPDSPEDDRTKEALSDPHLREWA
jgi:hypothetical protein